MQGVLELVRPSRPGIVAQLIICVVTRLSLVISQILDPVSMKNTYSNAVPKMQTILNLVFIYILPPSILHLNISSASIL